MRPGGDDLRIESRVPQMGTDLLPEGAVPAADIDPRICAAKTVQGNDKVATSNNLQRPRLVEVGGRNMKVA